MRHVRMSQSKSCSWAGGKRLLGVSPAARGGTESLELPEANFWGERPGREFSGGCAGVQSSPNPAALGARLRAGLLLPWSTLGVGILPHLCQGWSCQGRSSEGGTAPSMQTQIYLPLSDVSCTFLTDSGLCCCHLASLLLDFPLPLIFYQFVWFCSQQRQLHGKEKKSSVYF